MKYTARRKVEILNQIDAAPDKTDEIMQQHFLSFEELQASWAKVQKHGKNGLSVRALQRERREA